MTISNGIKNVKGMYTIKHNNKIKYNDKEGSVGENGLFATMEEACAELEKMEDRLIAEFGETPYDCSEDRDDDERLTWFILLNNKTLSSCEAWVDVDEQTKHEENVKYLSHCIGIMYNGETDSGTELEAYTPAGEDMIINLDKLTRAEFLSWVDDFDINERVVMWWPNGHKAEGQGVPFNNIMEHYLDYQKFLNTMRKIAEGMPY